MLYIYIYIYIYRFALRVILPLIYVAGDFVCVLLNLPGSYAYSRERGGLRNRWNHIQKKTSSGFEVIGSRNGLGRARGGMLSEVCRKQKCSGFSRRSNPGVAERGP